MTDPIRAAVNPSILTWAREAAGFSQEQAAKKAGASLETFLEWEAGTQQPTVRQARLLGKAYHRPAAFFYLSSPPETPPDPPDLRRIADPDSRRTPRFIHELRRARFRRQLALELLRAQGEEPSPFKLALSVGDGATLNAKTLRDTLGVSIEEQFRWPDAYEALAAWTRAAETTGALVFQFGRIEVHIARGFSIAERPLPIVSLNAKDAPTARVFTLLHEISHLALSRPAICDLHEGEPDFPIETYCNAMAAETLVPAAAFLAQPQILQNRDPALWSDEDIRGLARRFHVSREVVLRRLLELGKTTQAFYRRKRAELLQEYEEIPEGKAGFVLYHKKVIRDNGPAFTSLVLNAYYQQAISLVDVSRYLGGFRLGHLSTIEHELLG